MKNNDLPLDITASLELDPLSDRYRVCPYCRKPHMVRNKGRDFCSDRCADQHYNARRRLMKQAEPKNAVAIVQEVAVEPETAAQPQIQTVEIVQPKASQPTPQEKESGDSVYERNIQILDSLKVRIPEGTSYQIDALTKGGFDFNAYSGRGALYNIDPKLNCHFILYGTYRIYRVDFSHVLITKVEPLKPKTDD